MKEIKGDIWDYHSQGAWVVITTNGDLKKDGSCVMGRGIALQAANRFPTLPSKLGELIIRFGNKVFMFTEYRVFTFPVKHHWHEKADPRLIEKSAEVLSGHLPSFDSATSDIVGKVFMPRVGSGNGGLSWEDVKPIIDKYLFEKVTIVDINS